MMTRKSYENRESGFTLVELSIVLLIIGLLVGGVLQGQEMIESARVSSTAQDMKAIEAAMNNFEDKYAGIPGDIQDPADRLPNCANRCDFTTNTGDGQIDQGAGVANTAAGTAVWAQMAAGDVLSGPAADADSDDNIGESAPAADIGGGFLAGYGNGTDNREDNQHYIWIAQDLATAMGAGDNGVMTAAQAGQIDRKLDDGHSRRGSVRASNRGNCDTAGGDYNTANTSNICSVYKAVIN